MKQNATLDSSFWINAHRSGLLPYVLDKFNLRYTPDVALELREEFSSGREFWRLVRQNELTEASPSIQQVKDFGTGERSAINLALEHSDWILLIDDRRPYLEGMRLGLRVLCTSVLAVELYSEGKLDGQQTLTILARLASFQTLSPELLAVAMAQLGRVWKDK